jgi:AhpD family alkylhydroperoxidase
MTLNELDKEFVAVGAAIGAGCHPCTQYHTGAALKAGLNAEQVLWAVEQAQGVRANGGVAVANVGRRIVGVDQQEAPALEPAACRYGALVALGAATGCNSGVLLGEYAERAIELGLNGGDLRETIDVAETVKAMAGKFLLRDIERVLGPAVASAQGCAPGYAVPAAAGAGAWGGASGCGCGAEQ